MGTVLAQAPIPVIDTHIHLFDTNRKEGVPWPPKDDKVRYKPALPPRYRALTKEFGIVGAIEVEASPWLEDNQWVLDVAAGDTIIVGTVGNLEPGKPGFAKNLERFHKNPLFRGIRCGNIWGRDLSADVKQAAIIADLKLLASAGLSLDSANPNQALLEALLAVANAVPGLRIVIDHLPGMAIPDPPKGYNSVVRELAKHPGVYVKISAVLGAKDPKARIDEIFGTFGEDRVLFGSDWPNSDGLGPYAQVFRVVRDYFMAKGRPVAEKYFWRNSVAAYRWVKRDASQPSA